MPSQLTDSRLANIGARTIYDGFDAYQQAFHSITRRARQRFQARDWRGMQADAAERLDLYATIVDQVVSTIRELLAERLQEKLVWVSMKAVYSGLIADRDDWELAETFFNSITRRIFKTIGVDPQIEFVATDFETPPTQASRPVYRIYDRAASTEALIRAILIYHRFQVQYEDIDRDARLVAERVEAHLRSTGALRVVDRAEIIKTVFYRAKGAYLVGRLFSGAHVVPFVLALLHRPEGIVVDAVLLNEDDVSILFSFARSYFHVMVDRPYDLVHFLKAIMPRKRIAELYISLGYNKHGKTELYRDVLQHLATSNDVFEIARGERGMVMIVFVLPGYDLVFKTIKDRFPYPKDTTRRAVMEKYWLVFRHDRAGRLADAQEFEYLKFRRDRFSPALLAELQNVAAQTIEVLDEYVIIKHAYVERRMTPLNIYVREADETAARAAVIDYGNAIKDLAATNIFPGDMLVKNFGVTRHGRVVFYDYDELCLLTECNFRKIPQPRWADEELAPEPWYSVGEQDVFPEEFAQFLGMGLPPSLRAVFQRHHCDLFDVAFWCDMQQRLESGEVIHVFPYDQECRLRDPQCH